MMSWKVYARKRLWPNFRYYLAICLEELMKTMKNLWITGLRAEI
jgi:hypothetical protein